MSYHFRIFQVLSQQLRNSLNESIDFHINDDNNSDCIAYIKLLRPLFNRMYNCMDQVEDQYAVYHPSNPDRKET